MRDELLKIWRENVSTLLDLGCRDCWFTTALPGITRHVGVDAWQPALERGTNKDIPHFEPVLADALEYTSGLDDGSFDAVVAIDLVEHLTEEDALDLLDQMGRVARKLAVVWTTNGFIAQAGYDVDGNENPFEEHRWGPTAQLFDRLGWRAKVWPRWHGDRGGAILAWLSKR